MVGWRAGLVLGLRAGLTAGLDELLECPRVARTVGGLGAIWSHSLIGERCGAMLERSLRREGRGLGTDTTRTSTSSLTENSLTAVDTVRLKVLICARDRPSWICGSVGTDEGRVGGVLGAVLVGEAVAPPPLPPCWRNWWGWWLLFLEVLGERVSSPGVVGEMPGVEAVEDLGERTLVVVVFKESTDTVDKSAVSVVEEGVIWLLGARLVTVHPHTAPSRSVAPSRP